MTSSGMLLRWSLLEAQRHSLEAMQILTMVMRLTSSSTQNPPEKNMNGVASPLRRALAARAKFSKATKEISITRALRMAHIIIFNTYFWLGNVIMLQTIGIPMGTNPSPAFSDLYLYAYEYAFALQLWATAAGRDILCRFFAVVARFQDDIFMGEAPYFQRAIDGQVYWSAESPTTSAVQDPAHPFKGCYPCQFIQTNPEQRTEKKAFQLPIAS